MTATTIQRQAGLTIKMLTTLLAHPKVTASELSKLLGVSTSTIANMLMKFREAGIDIDYDFSNRTYVGKFAEQFKESVIAPYADRVRTTIGGRYEPEMSEVKKIERYTVTLFAQKIGTSPQNVQNMLSGYKGQKLTRGWVAFQLVEGGRWTIQKAEVKNNQYVVPASVKKEAFQYVIGDTQVIEPRQKTVVCQKPKCGKPVFAKGLCAGHYQKNRRAARK